MMVEEKSVEKRMCISIEDLRDKDGGKFSYTLERLSDGRWRAYKTNGEIVFGGGPALAEHAVEDFGRQIERTLRVWTGASYIKDL